jgi:hypothetical protein
MNTSNQASVYCRIGLEDKGIMEDEKSGELKNKISELKHRLNQMYAQYFSDTREGRVFETEFSLYIKASEHARHEKSEQLRLQHGIMKTGVTLLIASAALIIFLFRDHVLFSSFFLLGLGFFAWGFMHLMLAAEIRIAKAERFCSSLGKYFQQYRWSTESAQGLRLPDIPLWDDYADPIDSTFLQSKQYEGKSLYLPFRIVISLIDLLMLVLLIQSLVPGESTMNRLTATIGIILWIVSVYMHVFLINALINHAEIIRNPKGPDITEREQTGKPYGTSLSWKQIPRIFFLLDVIFPKADSYRKTG